MEQPKNKIVKDVVSCERFSSISIVYDVYLYFRALMVLAIHCYCGDNVKYGLLSKYVFQN